VEREVLSSASAEVSSGLGLACEVVDEVGVEVVWRERIRR
jgi:hypothetical protein